MIKSNTITWAGHVTRMEEKRNVYGILVRKPKEKRPLGKPIHSGRMILKWILEIGWGDIG
jgi:hypothetical protein